MEKRNFNIGRDETCEIVISDSQGVVSRKHAILRSLPFGRYEIIDVSKNGTFVNGKRLRPHKAVRVKRTDVITFANTYKMDWNDVPRQRSVAMIAAYCLVGLIVVIFLIFGIKALVADGGSDDYPAAEPAMMRSEQKDESPKDEGTSTSSAFGETIDEGNASESFMQEEEVSTSTAPSQTRQKRREDKKTRQTSTSAKDDKSKSTQTTDTPKAETEKNNTNSQKSTQSEPAKKNKRTGGD